MLEELDFEIVPVYDVINVLNQIGFASGNDMGLGIGAGAVYAF